MTLRVLGCLPPTHSRSRSKEESLATADGSGRTAGPSAAPHRSALSLSPQQVTHSNLVSLKDRLHRSCCHQPLIGWSCTSPCDYICSLQVDETVDWLSDYFLRSRLSKADLRSFGLYSTWTPYISEIVSFWDHLVRCLINGLLSNCARESVGSSKVLTGECHGVGGQSWRRSASC